MKEIAAEIPGVRFVQTHREVSEVAGSLASLCYSMLAATSPRVDPQELGVLALWLLRWLAETCLEQREHGDLKVVDVYYADLVSDPVATVHRLYDEHGLEWTDAIEQAVRDGAARRPQHQQGRHRYELSDFGLTDAEVLDALRPYAARFLGHPRSEHARAQRGW